jgi:hypothetical protein
LQSFWLLVLQRTIATRVPPDASGAMMCLSHCVITAYAVIGFPWQTKLCSEHDEKYNGDQVEPVNFST